MSIFPYLWPVCGKYSFVEPFEECPVCNWTFDGYQEEYVDSKNCANIMSLNEAKEAYKKGEKIH